MSRKMSRKMNRELDRETFEKADQGLPRAEMWAAVEALDAKERLDPVDAPVLDHSLHLRAAASAAVVNRTHRVVRERAKAMQDRRSMFRSLTIPLSVCAGLFVAVVFAVWSVVDQYEITVDAIPDSSQGMMVLMMWCLPLSMVVMAVVWFSRSGSRGDGNRFESNRMDGR